MIKGLSNPRTADPLLFKRRSAVQGKFMGFGQICDLELFCGEKNFLLKREFGKF
jgi:hypothetical protein